MFMKPSVLAISYAKRALDPSSRERARLRSYMSEFEQYHIIVFTRLSEDFPSVQQDGNLTLYATGSLSKVAMVARAFKVGKEILAAHKQTRFILSSQDPFESSFVARMLGAGRMFPHNIQVHGDVFNPRSYRSSLLQWSRSWYGRFVIKRANSVRVVSERIKQSIQTIGVPPERIEVLPIQADLNTFLEVGKKRFVATESEKKTPLRLLYAGRLASEKNLSMLLRACALVQSKGVDFEVRMVGSGPELSDLQVMTSELELSSRITFIEWTDDIAVEMAEADVFCLPSNHEGWGMVLQEAAAAGLAIVTTDVGCVGELLKHEREALVTPVGDKNAFAEAIMSLQDCTRRTTIGRQAHQKILQNRRSQEEYIKILAASHLPRTDH